MIDFIEPAHVYRVRESLKLDSDSIVSQEHAHDCDVTVILGRYARTGQLPPGRGPGAYEDVSALCGADHSGAIEVLRAANSAVLEAQKAESDINQKIRDYMNSPPPPLDPSAGE